MSLVCMEARQWMQARAAGLSEADRLRLEEHTSSCNACRGQSVALSNLVELAQSALPTLTETARLRTIGNAFAQLDREAVPTLSMTPRTTWVWSASFGGAALAAAIVLLLWFGGRELTPRAQPPSQPPAVQSVRADQARHMVIEGAELDLAAGTTLDWDARLAHVTLHSGRVRARVASRQGKPPFMVITPEFRVVVIGTDFEVTLDSVLVYEGVVRLETVEGRELHPGLRATQRWTSVPDAIVENTSPSASAAVSSSTSPSELRVREPVLTIGQWLSQARTRLSEGDVVGARMAITRAQRLRAERAERAEAETLLAECFQVEGKIDAAISQYQRVAHAYRDVSAGDNAAYAASRLTLKSGQRDRAAELFGQYLREHPAGLFRAEAQRALTQLEANSHGASGH